MTSLAVSADEAGRMLGLHRNRIYELCGRGELRCAHYGRRWLIPRIEVVNWLQRMSGVDLTVEAAVERYDALFEAQTGGLRTR